MQIGRWLNRLVLLAALAFTWTQASHYRYVLDDAFISLRYARNLGAGSGLVFNPGLPPVEGYTNFLWVLIEAAIVPLTAWPEHVLLAFDVLFGFLVLLAVWREMVLRGPEAERWAWLAALLVGSHETLHAWMGGGLETTLFMLLVTVGVGGFLREHAHIGGVFRSAIPLGLAALTRPEAYLPIAVCGIILMKTALFDRRERQRAGRWFATLGGFCAPHLAFRRLYYGEWVPNTFFAKIPGPYFASGVPYLQIYSAAFYGGWLVLACLVVWSAVDAGRTDRTFGRDRATLAAIVAGWFGYIAYAGGDHFEFRLLAPTVPLAALLIALTASDFATNGSGRIAATRLRTAIATVAGLAIVFRTVWSGQRPRYADDLFHRLRIPSGTGLARANYAEKWRPAGEWLRRFAAAGERISVPAAGVIPWVSQLVTLDTHGLNDRTIAHRPISKRGVLAHEKSATWDDVIRFGVTYHVDDLSFRERPLEFPNSVLDEESRVIVELPTHQWMNVGAVKDAEALRLQLRERGAVVNAGPHEDVNLVKMKNALNRPSFDAWCGEVEQERQRRLRGSWIPLSR